MKTGKMFTGCAVGVAVAGLTAWTGINTQAAITYDTRALTGDAAPGTGPGVIFTLFNTPVLNGAGQTAFRGFLTGSGVDGTNNGGIWSEGSGPLVLVAREGDAAPGTGLGVVYSFFNTPLLNGAGQTAFLGFLSGSGVIGTNDSGIWAESLGSLSLVAREGTAAPDTGPGVVYSGFFSFLAFNETGQTAFNSGLSGTAVDDMNDGGIWSGSSGSISLIAREGATAPDTGPGVMFGGFGTPVINGVGQTAVNGTLAGAGVDDSNNSAIWSESSGSLSMIAREGNQAAGTDPGVVYWYLKQPDLNDAGKIAFYGGLTGEGVDETNNHGVWSDGSGSLNLVARSGDNAPGTEPGVVFSDFDRPVVNGAGHIAFTGSLTGVGVDSTNDFGIWSEGSGSLNLLGRTGYAAPGTASGVVFADFRPPMLNGAGQVAFKAPLAGVGVDSTNSYGIWATDPNGQLTLVVRDGNLFDVNNDPLIDDFRTISAVALAVNTGGGEDGRASSYNDAGQLAFRLGFTDGSWGIFVATIGLGGDLNGDGFVGIADLNAVIGNWNQNVTPGDVLAGDPSGDGFVGIEDLNAVLGSWNEGTPPGAPNAGGTVPEPGAAVVVWVGVGVVLRRRKRAC